MRHLNKIIPVIIVLIVIAVIAIKIETKNNTVPAIKTETQDAKKIISGSFDKTKFKTDKEWQQMLSPAEYKVMREEGTEIPYTGSLEHEKRKGIYYSKGCDIPLFSSEQKYDSGTGWPSFWDPIDINNLVLREDTSIPGAPRIEVLDRCGNHLGHVFDDGPEPTGKRYCMNSIALKFIPEE